MKTLAILPPHLIDGVEPTQWRIDVIRTVEEMKSAVGGQHQLLVKSRLSTEDASKVRSLLSRFDGWVRDADAMAIAVPRQPHSTGESRRGDVLPKIAEAEERLRELRRRITESPDDVKFQPMGGERSPVIRRFNRAATSETKALAAELYANADSIIAPDFRPLVRDPVTTTDAEWDLALASAARMTAGAKNTSNPPPALPHIHREIGPRFTITPSEIRALQQHAKSIEDYEVRRGEEEKRLWHNPALVDALPPLPQWELSQVMPYNVDLARVTLALRAFDGKYKPPLNPWETPAKILETIEVNIGVRGKELRSFANLPPADKFVLYEKIHQRVRLFHPLARSVLFDFPLQSNPTSGITHIEDWCWWVMSALPAGNADVAAADQSPAVSHSADFTTVRWFGIPYVFDDGLQAKAVECLWAEHEKGGHGLSEKTIAERIGSASNNYRLASTFRNHPAWNTMISRVRQGIYRLKKPE